MRFVIRVRVTENEVVYTSTLLEKSLLVMFL